MLNLLATECLAEIAADLGWQFAICPAVRDEVKRLRDPATGEMVLIEIEPLIASGLLQVLELTGDAEQAAYVEQAIFVDDGEAMSIALAACRSLELAMDDKQATNHAHRAFPAMKIWTTPEILEHWIKTAGVSRERCGEIVRLIESRARYFPARSHPLAGWWYGLR